MDEVTLMVVAARSGIDVVSRITTLLTSRGADVTALRAAMREDAPATTVWIRVRAADRHRVSVLSEQLRRLVDVLGVAVVEETPARLLCGCSVPATPTHDSQPRGTTYASTGG